MKKIILLLGLIIFTVVFLKFGRSIYMPLLNKVTEKETVDSITKRLEQTAFQRLEQNLNKAGFENLPEDILLVAFKEERTLQVYATDNRGFKLIKEYPFTAYSGKLGPKLKEGDKQIPEGIYKVEYLNPNSSYYLSIKVSYPNAFDKSKNLLSSVTEMGGDIFIHGKAATIGCIPIGDDAIEEVFLLTQKAIKKGVKVIISPRDFRTNKELPNITAIDWEEELYQMIEKELDHIPSN